MFEQKVRRGTSLMFQLAFKYFSIKLGLTEEEMNMINIKTVKRLPGAQGNCSGEYLRGELQRVNIKILNCTDLGLIDVMAHEMVHARQNLRGEFTFSVRKKYKWFGLWPYVEVIRMHKDQVLNDTPYYEQHCEQEAYMMSREMVRQFLNFMYHLENNVTLMGEQEEAQLLLGNESYFTETQYGPVAEHADVRDDDTRVYPLDVDGNMVSSSYL